MMKGTKQTPPVGQRNEVIIVLVYGVTVLLYYRRVIINGASKVPTT